MIPSMPAPAPRELRLPAERGARALAWSKCCGACRRNYGSAEWEALAIVESLAPAAVQAHLSVPAEWTVELRRCTCGVTLATRARVAR
jgi:hypothetical protein